MKLYVWDDALTDYTSGIMFAVAESLDEAKQKVYHSWRVQNPGWTAVTATKYPEEYKDCSEHQLKFSVPSELKKEPDVYDLDVPFGFFCYGGG